MFFVVDADLCKDFDSRFPERRIVDASSARRFRIVGYWIGEVVLASIDHGRTFAEWTPESGVSARGCTVAAAFPICNSMKLAYRNGHFWLRDGFVRRRLCDPVS